MKAVKIAKGEQFIQKGERLKNLYVLLQGQARAVYRTDSWDLEPGSIIGLCGCNSEVYLCDYISLSNCVLYAYEYTRPEDFLKIFQEDKKYVSIFVMAAMRQTAFYLRRYREYYDRARTYYGFLMEMYQEYERFCEDYQCPKRLFKRMETAKPFVVQNDINQCMIDFYEKMAGMSLETIENFLERDVHLGIGEILNSTDWMYKALNLIEDIREYLLPQKELLLSDSEDNLYQRYVELVIKASEEGSDTSFLQETIAKIIDYAQTSQLYQDLQLDVIFDKYKNYNFVDNGLSETDIWEEYDEEEEELQVDFLEQILSYAEYEDAKAKELTADIAMLKNLADLYSVSDDVRQLRRRLVDAYYEIYTSVFKKSLENPSVPEGIKMFLYFGFMDTELAGEDTVKSLRDVVEQISVCKAPNVYTIYEWLLSVYRGENEPSKNEFDLDYPAYLNELKKTGKISEAEQRSLAQDNWSKTEFEIKNMFASNNKLTYGKISSYCPILCEYDVINTVENMLVTAEKINGALDEIRNVDFSIFYRQVVFSDPGKDINMEMIQKEVLPIVILMPNAGSRAMMWQETAGIKRDTPARFVFPIMTVADVKEMMVEVAGRYRWEICRKIQGVHWNDISDPSLTSEYNDYIQYYRKNFDLSADAKEKIKKALYKSKNNFREVFVRDYQNWITYESKGSFRLNKVAREILYKYCPFSKGIQQSLGINPMYQELFNRYKSVKERNIRRIELLYERYRKKGGEITKELQDNRDFYDL